MLIKQVIELRRVKNENLKIRTVEPFHCHSLLYTESTELKGKYFLIAHLHIACSMLIKQVIDQ